MVPARSSIFTVHQLVLEEKAICHGKLNVGQTKTVQRRTSNKSKPREHMKNAIPILKRLTQPTVLAVAAILMMVHAAVATTMYISANATDWGTSPGYPQDLVVCDPNTSQFCYAKDHNYNPVRVISWCCPLQAGSPPTTVTCNAPYEGNFTLYNGYPPHFGAWQYGGSGWYMGHCDF